MEMRRFSRISTYIFIGAALCSAGVQAKKDARDSELFNSNSRLNIKIYTDWDQLLAGKKMDHLERPYVNGSLVYTNEMGEETLVPSKYQVRGWWRLSNCKFPPLKWKFDNNYKDLNDPLFSSLDGLKIVSQCGGQVDHTDPNDPKSERKNIREKAIYDLQAIITPWSFKTRNARISYFDTSYKPPRTIESHNAFFLEAPDDLGDRFELHNVDVPKFLREELQKIPLALGYVFNYMIGNPDGLISKKELRNFKIYSTYDFSKTEQNDYKIVIDTGRAQNLDFYSVAFDFDLSQFATMNICRDKKSLEKKFVVCPFEYDFRVKGICGMANLDENRNGKNDVSEVVEMYTEKADQLLAFVLNHGELNQVEKQYLMNQLTAFFNSFGVTLSVIKNAETQVFEVRKSINPSGLRMGADRLYRVASRECNSSED